MAGPNVVALDRLKAQLLTSGLQERNNALFQVINQLIDNLRQGIDTLSTQITTISGGGGGGGGSTTTLITSGALIPQDGEDGRDGMPGIPGPQGLQGPIGPMGPPGMDADSDDWSMPFIGNSIYDGVTLTGPYTQRM